MRYLPSTICPGSMNFAKLGKKGILGQPPRLIYGSVCFLVCLLLLIPIIVHGEDEFSFELDEIEKKPLQWGGYAELKWEHMKINQGSAFSSLNLSDPSLSTRDRFSGSLQIDGRYDQGIISLNWTLKAAAQQDDLGWADTTDIYETYVSIKPTPHFTGGLGKKAYKWGKGYAWDPVGFINRRKDPNDPEEALEGYITGEIDLIKSFAGPLQTAALTTVILPVWDEVNDDFGEINNVNLAVKLYLLYYDTDIDLIYYSGNSRSTRYGLDFSRNLATNFEIHGEFAYIPDQKRVRLLADYSVLVEEISATSWLLGLRYLSENDLTSIIEYYHNDAGYSKEDMDHFFQLIAEGENQFIAARDDSLLSKAQDLSLKGYGRPQPGRNYLYTKFSQKEPYDILYLSPGLTTIVNLDDSSFSVTPEVVYTGITNWEMRLRFSYFGGGKSSEYGEKLYRNKLEVRLRYFF